MLLQQIYNGVALGSIYALIAISITLVYGLSRIINFAVGEYITLAGFLSYSVYHFSGSFTVALIAAVAAISVLGLVTERFAFRFAFKTPISGFVISLGLIFVLQGVAVMVWGINPHYVLPYFQGAWDLGAVVVVKQSLVNIVVAAIALAVFFLVLGYTQWGKALRAVSDDPGAAALAGVPVNRTIMSAFVAGSALAGIAGWLVLATGTITPFTGETYLLRGFAVALIGGLGSIVGAAVAGVGLGIAEALAAGYVDPGWNDATVFGFMIAVLLLRPTGLAGGSEGAKI